MLSLRAAVHKVLVTLCIKARQPSLLCQLCEPSRSVSVNNIGLNGENYCGSYCPRWTMPVEMMRGYFHTKVYPACNAGTVSYSWQVKPRNCTVLMRHLVLVSDDSDMVRLTVLKGPFS